ncbi:MAG: hypothetical protein JNK81_06130 [Anaerolineales bacterium]|nr:hypothetical protein [Anaerolineales bacterium]
METSREFWHRWAESLRRYQLQDVAASLLEATSPLALIGAQALYFSGGFVKNDQLTALATMLEDESEARAFASFLTQTGSNQ